MITVITYNFISLKTSFFYIIINPTCPRNILHILHGHTSGKKGRSPFDFEFESIERFRFFISLGSDSFFQWVLNLIFLDLEEYVNNTFRALSIIYFSGYHTTFNCTTWCSFIPLCANGIVFELYSFIKKNALSIY